MASNHKGTFLFVVIVLTSLCYFATDVYMPALPSMTLDLNTTISQAQLTIAVYMFSFGIGPLFFGPLSDSYGRKPTALIGIVLAIVSTLVCIWANNIYLIIGARFFQGIGLSAVVTVARAVIPDRYHGKEMATFNSTIAIVMPVILAIAPTVGGILNDLYGWRIIFVFLVAYLLFALLLVIYTLPETLQNPSKFSLRLSKYTELLTNRRFMYWCLIPPLVSIGIGGFITAGPFLFQNVLGMTATHFGMLSLIIGVSLFIFAIVNTQLLKYVDTAKLIYFGSLLQILSGLFLITTLIFNHLSIYSLLITCLVYFSSLPFTFPNGISLAFDTLKQNYGIAGAFFSTLQVLFMFVASMVFSLLPADTAYPLAISFVFVGLLSYYCLYMQRRLGSDDALPEEI